MTKYSRNIICTTLIFLTILFRSSSPRNTFDNLDLTTQTLNPLVTGFMMTGNAATDLFGYSVSKAGDIDNDGYGDIIVGAYAKNSNKGAVYVIYGGEKSSMSNILLSSTTLDPLTTGFMITGNAAGDYFGWSVSTAGDINKDGYDDIIVGAYVKNTVYVIYGGPKSTMSNIDLSTQTLYPLTTGFMITGNTANDYFGFSVSTAGDIDNDGYDDIIVGANRKNTFQGAAYVIYGRQKSLMSNIDLSSQTLSPLTTGFLITGNAGNDQFGSSVSKAGDIDNDGYDDLIVGAYAKNSVRGAAYVIYGGPKSSMSNLVLGSTTLNPLTTGFTITGSVAPDQLGRSVGTAGDLNNDGYDDIIVGAHGKNSYYGAVYVIYGGPKSSMSNWDFSSGATLTPSTTGFMILGKANSFFGISVSTTGDINKDGYDDIIVGSSPTNTAYVIYGGPKSAMSNILLSSTTLDPTSTGFVITGNAATDNFASSVSTAGDINNDGYDDIIIGAYSKNSAYVIYASCPMNCKQCSSEPICTECKNPYLFYQSDCFTSCPDATFATSSTACDDCPTHCNHCSSTSICTECKNPYLFYQSECFASCPDTTFASTANTCEDCISPCSQCTDLSVCTECLGSFVLYNSFCLPSCPNAMYNSNKICKDCPSYCSSCSSENSCQACYQGYTLSNSNSRCVLSSDSSQQQATQAISSATQGVGSVVSIGSSIFPFSALVSKIVQNTRYLNLTVTSELSEVYQSWRTDLISWDVPNVMSNLDQFETLPSMFAKYDLDSPFLVNFWPTLINIVIGFSTFIACILLKKLFEHVKYKGWAYSLLLKLVAGSFNFALIQAYACLDDILFYLVLDAKTNPFNNFFSWASLISAVIFLALGCLLVFFNFWTVYKYQKIKPEGAQALEIFNERNKYWELFYSDFSDEDLWSQSFFAILIVRSSISSFIITVLSDYPLLQTSLLVITDLAILSFLYFQTPFNTLRGKLAQYYFETITLLVHLCTFVLSLQDTFENPSENVKKIFSTGIIYLNTALITGAIGFMFIEIYKTISQKTRAAKRKQYETIAIQTGPEEILKTSPDQRKLNQEASSCENLHLLQGMNQQSNTELSALNLESSQILETNLGADNSRELEISTSQERDQSTAPILIRRKLRILNPRQQKNNL